MFNLTEENVTRLDRLRKLAIEHWGESAQFEQAKEEALELSLELQRVIRGRHDWNAIAEESVDNFIMMTEMFHIFGPELINDLMKKKLDKFEAGLNKSIERRGTL